MFRPPSQHKRRRIMLGSDQILSSQAAVLSPRTGGQKQPLAQSSINSISFRCALGVR